jgi:hypothetical protein
VRHAGPGVSRRDRCGLFPPWPTCRAERPPRSPTCPAAARRPRARRLLALQAREDLLVELCPPVMHGVPLRSAAEFRHGAAPGVARRALAGSPRRRPPRTDRCRVLLSPRRRGRGSRSACVARRRVAVEARRETLHQMTRQRHHPTRGALVRFDREARASSLRSARDVPSHTTESRSLSFRAPRWFYLGP